MHDFAGKGAIIQTEMAQTWELLTEEQKRKVAIMRTDLKIQWVKAKIHNMEKLTPWSYLTRIWKHAGKPN